MFENREVRRGHRGDPLSAGLVVLILVAGGDVKASTPAPAASDLLLDDRHWGAPVQADVFAESAGSYVAFGTQPISGQRASDLPLMAAADGSGADAAPVDQPPLSAECAAFATDPNADVGDIIRAGCQPTTAQMSKLMDNPLGNVAMLFTQFDLYRMENPTNGKERNKGFTRASSSSQRS